MINSWTQTKIALKNLALWDENARFSDQYFNQPESVLIKQFLLKHFKVVDLAEKIVQDFDLPQLEKFIVYRLGNKNTAIEGNRRLTAYKILANPNLAEDTILRKKLLILKRKIKITNEFTVECLVTENLEQGYRYLERKHLNKNNEISWGDNERTHYKDRRGKATEKEKLKVEITKIIQNSNLDRQIKEKILGPRYVTTFWRLMQQTPAQTVFGFTLEDKKKFKINDSNFGDKLKVVVWDVLQKGRYNGKLFSRLTNKDIENYLKSIPEKRYKNIDKEIRDSKKPTLYGEELTFIREPKTVRKTPVVGVNSNIFGKTLSLGSGYTNNLYRAIDKIYNQNQYDNTILPIIGMSLRLILEIAGREYFSNSKDPTKRQLATSDKVYEKFLKEAKNKMDKAKINYVSLTMNWISSKETITGLLHKYAHGNITSDRNDILQASLVVGDILETFFGKNEK